MHPPIAVGVEEPAGIGAECTSPIYSEETHPPRSKDVPRMETTVQEKVEIARIIVAAIEKHARGKVEALARGIIAGLHTGRIRDPARKGGAVMIGGSDLPL